MFAIEYPMIALSSALGMSSLRGARLGIDGLVFLILFSISVYSVVYFLSRHEYDPPFIGIFGVIIASIAGASIGGMIGHQLSPLISAVFVCGLFTLMSSGPFLDFRLPHRCILSLVTPLLYFTSLWLGSLVQSATIKAMLE